MDRRTFRKIDISDGFYRLWLRPEDTIKLAVLFPSHDGKPALIGIPLTIPMGWRESPPKFCACTETVADLAYTSLENTTVFREARSTLHRLDEGTETPPPVAPPSPPVIHPNFTVTNPFRKPLRYWNIYVDDFCGLVQGNQWTRRAVKRVLFQALDRVFRPLDEDDIPERQEPASIKKLKKGDGTWATSKVVLGWLIDTLERAITLPEHRVARLHEILATIPHHKKSSQRKNGTKFSFDGDRITRRTGSLFGSPRDIPTLGIGSARPTSVENSSWLLG